MGSGDDTGSRPLRSGHDPGGASRTESGRAPRPSQSIVPPVDEYTSGITMVSRSDHPAEPFGRARRGSVTVSLEAQSILSGAIPAPADVRGAARLLEHTLHVAPRASVLLLVSVEEEASLGAAFLSAMNDLGIHPVVYLVDPEEGSNTAFLRRLSVQIPEVAACIAVQGSRPFSSALREVLVLHPFAVIVEVPTDAVARQALRADLDELHRLGLTLIERVRAEAIVSISSGLALSLTAEIDPNEPPIHHGGELAPHRPLSLPAGRVVFPCSRVDGAIAADGGVWLADGRVLGRGASTQVEVERGLVTRVAGAAADELEQLLEENPSLRRVSAIGFGTNTSLVAGVGAREIDLCLPGAYALLGDASEPRRTVAVTPRRPGVRAGNDAWMVRGRWSRELL